ncbi:unnamed protein product [Somion occarium]|uniref:NAD-dependent epimerase/dehydratase domain-containing protein n=1 Tax=Somion occarium TaxID=3059160 RepID=A0ABP1DHW8_9APHY
MPAVTSGKVLVTGANGYIAVWLVKDLLEKGFTVRGTVRSAAKGEHLKKTFASYGDKLELVVVDDITKTGAFDEAVKGVDAIQHTASPFHFNITDPQDLIVPAVAGTTSILESALKHGSTVKRVVVLSSTAAVQTTDLEKPTVFNENNWNDKAVNEVETKGKETSPFDSYMASKTLAERAAWAWYEKNKAAIQWDLVVFNPPYVYGPIIHEIQDLSQLNTSMGLFYTVVLKGETDDQTLVKEGNNWIDVRDVSSALVLALFKEEAANQRFIISGGTYKWQDWVNAVRKVAPTLPAGNTSYKPEEAIHEIVTDSSKSKQVLGIKYRTFDETAKDIVADFEKKGWWPVQKA